MAISFVNVAIANGTVSPAAVTAPAHNVNDFLLVLYAQDSTTRNLTTPTGWNLVTGSPSTSSSHRSSVLYRIADGTATDDFSATLSGATNWIVALSVYRGVDTAAPVETQGANFDASSVTAHPTPSITPTTNDSTIWAACSTDSVSSVKTYTNSDASYTERFDNSEATGFLAIGGYDAPGPNPAAATSTTITSSGAEVGNQWILALKPAAAATVPPPRPHVYLQAVNRSYQW